MIIGRTKLEKERKFFVERVVDRGGGRCARAPGTHPAGAGRGVRGRTRRRGRYHYYPYLASAGNHGSVSYNLSVINPLSSSKESAVAYVLFLFNKKDDGDFIVRITIGISTTVL